MADQAGALPFPVFVERMCYSRQMVHLLLIATEWRSGSLDTCIVGKHHHNFLSVRSSEIRELCQFETNSTETEVLSVEPEKESEG